MGTIIEKIREKMGKFPEVRLEHDASSITYCPYWPSLSSFIHFRFLDASMGRFNLFISAGANNAFAEGKAARQFKYHA
jgi:hypothetical protein